MERRRQELERPYGFLEKGSPVLWHAPIEFTAGETRIQDMAKPKARKRK